MPKPWYNGRIVLNLGVSKHDKIEFNDLIHVMQKSFTNGVIVCNIFLVVVISVFSRPQCTEVIHKVCDIF